MSDNLNNSLITDTVKTVIHPSFGEVITSEATGISYTMGEIIGEGNFAIVYSCTDVWGNDLAAKVLKPIASYDKVKSSAESEYIKLLYLRNPYITFVYDAFEYRDTFYIITERCASSVTKLFDIDSLNGYSWIKTISRSLLQAVHYLHINGYVHQDIHQGNVLIVFTKDEMLPDSQHAMQIKLSDLGIAKLLNEMSSENTMKNSIKPPEILNNSEYGPIDHRVDIYHIGLLFLQLAYSKEITFTAKEIINGKPREMALQLPSPYNFALEKALRRHVSVRTANAMELWRDLNSFN